MIPSTGGRARATCITLSVLLSIAMMAGPKGAEASTITLATPAGLQPGDTFRYMFVTLNRYSPDSTSIGTYDDYVNAELAALGVEYDGVPITGNKAVVSTQFVSARQHIAITETTRFRGVYNVGLSLGSPEQLALTQTSNPGGLWSGAIMTPVRWCVDGSQTDLSSAYTGTLANGDSSKFYMGGGEDGYNRLAVLLGYCNGSNTESLWINNNSGEGIYQGALPGWVLHPIYGITPLLTVPGGPSPVPEIDPATGSCALSLVAGVLAMIEQRRRRDTLVA